MLQLQQPDLTPYATTTLIQRRPNYVREAPYLEFSYSICV
jgi:hypothetical protein